MKGQYKNCIGYEERFDTMQTVEMKKIEFSIKELFGELPVDPEKFENLDPRLKWFGKLKDSETFCTSCGTLTPKVLYSHHEECCNHKSKVDCDDQEAYKLKCLGTEEQRSKRMSIKLENGQLKISIGLGILAHAVQYGDSWPEEVKISDLYEFGSDMVSIIGNDDNTSSNIYHRLDMAALEAVERGSLGFDLGE